MLLRLFMCLVFIQAIIFDIVDCRAHQVHKLRNHHVSQFGHHHTAQVQDRDEPLAATSESQLQQLRFPGEASSDNLTSDTHRHLVGRRGDNHDMVAICTLCPLPQEIYPCQVSGQCGRQATSQDIHTSPATKPDPNTVIYLLSLRYFICGSVDLPDGRKVVAILGIHKYIQSSSKKRIFKIHWKIN